jgi:hypothetical protein
MATIYSTTTQSGIDINQVFQLNTGSAGTPEYPRPPFLPGELAWGTDGSEWVYVTNSATVAPGSVLLISAVPGFGTAAGAWSVALIGGATVATAPTGQLIAVSGGGTGSVAVPSIATGATANFFWAQRAGNCQNVQTAASTTINAQLYSSKTVGGIVSSSAGGASSTYQINGLVISQATGSTAGPNTAILNYPVVGSSA